VLGAEVVRWAGTRRRPAVGPPLVVCGLTSLPLFYYLALSRLDASWERAGIANDFGTWPLWVTAVGLVAFALPALTAPPPDLQSFGEVALRVWPLAALAVFVLPFGTFPAHALQGLVLPLATLAFLGVGGGSARWRFALVLSVLVVPGTLYRADQLRGAVQAGRQPFFLRDGEHAALRWLDAAPRAGGVLAPIYTGLLVPAYTRRETWVGAGSWTPDFDARVQRAEALFSSRLDRAEPSGSCCPPAPASCSRTARGARTSARCSPHRDAPAPLRLRHGVGGAAVRRRLARAGAAILLAGPTALAFFSGGYFDRPRLVAALACCGVAAVAVVAARTPLPREMPGRVAVAGLFALGVLAGLSAGWAPLRGPALDDATRAALYGAAVLAAAALLRDKPVARAVEPALLAGSVLVILAGLSERLLPRSSSSRDRTPRSAVSSSP
jgi:hypothetical protein